MLNALHNKIREAFSRSSDRYDILASLHREIGREMMGKLIEAPAINTVLDIGCGTGYVAHKAKVYFSYSHVIGLDFAPGMIAKAHEKYDDINFVNADALHLPFRNQSIDLVVSNLAYQWISPLEQGFKEIKRVLSPKGTVALTLFGQATCMELMESLESVGIKPKRRLPSLDEVKEAMHAAGFNNVELDYERIQIQFHDLRELLGWLKEIGANHLPVDGFLGKQKFLNADAYYHKTYPYHHGISATFEVIWVKA